MIDIHKVIDHIKDMWFMMEPAYYIIIITHECVIDNEITNNICCGDGKIFLNSDYFSDKSESVLEECLKIECLRIMLKHPYSRALPNKVVMYMASNMCIANHTSFKRISLLSSYSIFGTHDYDGECYENLYKLFIKQNQNSGGKNSTESKSDSDGDSRSSSKVKNFKSDDLMKTQSDVEKNSSLWGENDDMSAVIDSAIGRIASTNNWGSVPNDVKSTILADDTPKYDYRNIIRLFRQSVINSSRNLTRMKPNRRFGYIQMGSKRGYTSNMLIVMDTSGSVGNDDISKTLGFIGGFFHCGFSRVDIVQFDVKVYDETLESFTKKPKFINTISRGGTDISDIVNFLKNRSKVKYDGVVICTDGYFSYDKNIWSSCNAKILWAINNVDGYEKLKDNIINTHKITYLDIYDND